MIIKTNHHGIPKGAGGSNSKNNIKKIEDRLHKLHHGLHGILPPHLCFELLMRIVGKPFTEKVKNDVRDILQQPPIEIYKASTIKDLDKLMESVDKGKWIYKI